MHITWLKHTSHDWKIHIIWLKHTSHDCTWLKHTYHMTEKYISHDWNIHITWLKHTSHRLKNTYLKHTSHDWKIHITWLKHTHHMTETHITWLKHTCHMTDIYIYWNKNIMTKNTQHMKIYITETSSHDWNILPFCPKIKFTLESKMTSSRLWHIKSTRVIFSMIPSSIACI